MSSLPPRAALLCPGQGSQRPGVVASLDRDDRAVFDRASAAIGVDLWELGLSAPAVEIAKPSVVQPLLVAWAQADRERAGREGRALPALHLYLGHSSGQNSAAVLCGALSFEDGVRFAYERGRLMDRDCAAAPTTLLALAGVGRRIAEEIAAAAGCTIANWNAADQFVVGGGAEAVGEAQRLAAARGVKAVALRVAGAFHTNYFRESDAAAEPLIEALPLRESFRPMIGNACGQLIETPAALRAELHGQYSRPVRWVDALQTAYDQGVRIVAVTGPGNALAGLLRRFALTVEEPIDIVRLNQPVADARARA
ncbi:MAG: ACP S-malonyltransferase [Chloroflexi bacterium]|nr:ACP S-malonyltransferase [Chloroflexota bacterium]